METQNQQNTENSPQAIDDKDLSEIPLLMNQAQVCEILGVSPSTYWRLVDTGRIKTIRISNRLLRVKRADLVAYLEGCQRPEKVAQA